MATPSPLPAGPTNTVKIRALSGWHTDSGGTSQKGRWSSFRNECYRKQPLPRCEREITCGFKNQVTKQSIAVVLGYSNKRTVLRTSRAVKKAWKLPHGFLDVPQDTTVRQPQLDCAFCWPHGKKGRFTDRYYRKIHSYTMEGFALFCSHNSSSQ